MDKYSKFRKIANKVSVDNLIIKEWKTELEKFYGFNLTEEIIINAFYFSLGQLYRMNSKSLFPLLDENGNMINIQSTMKREILMEAISLLETGYEFPKNSNGKGYCGFFEKNFDISLLQSTF